MSKRIVSVGYEIPGNSDLLEHHLSAQSLLDYDIVVFAPEPEPSTYRRHQGRAVLDETESFRHKEGSAHWRRELLTALDAGKTVFVFLGALCRFFTCTDRNAMLTHALETADNYQFLPVRLPTIVPKTGKGIVFQGNPVFASMWSDFQSYMTYECYIDGEIEQPLFVTRTGHRPVGGLFHVGRGHLVLLPFLDYDEEAFTEIDDEGEWCWTDDACQFGARLIQQIVGIDKALRAADETTPPPAWTEDDTYSLPAEQALRAEIGQLTEQIDELLDQKSKLATQLEGQGLLRGLLYEKGKPLENAVTLALEILGYQAENYDDGELELDQVILSPEGERFLGECEGKDTAAVNIEKLRQISENTHKDFEREEITERAIGILFGNGYRLKSPSEREQQFTEKCVSSARATGVIMVPTSDLFRVARYVRATGDAAFAEKCRKAIARSKGKIVSFPRVPKLPA